MPATAYALFDTTLGPCAIAWNGDAVAGVELPEGDPQATRRRAGRLWPEARESAPPPAIQCVIDEVLALLDGQAVDFATARLDDEAVPAFHRRVYDLARTIPPGHTLTYGEVALRLGEPGAAQAVGQALGANPFPIVVPCHRVVGADGRIGGFSAPGGAATKRRLLAFEGAWQYDQASLFD
ncbi:Methylated-DNA--protein-cysteine methyltransferase [Patulibacter medicamentivorans]|uniref:methylated-DNA--[protein]-cysteine S-methyltransferase n=1 Tax=Patulibacter medicamentivorans TaxID=1097667 RepID=H0EB80_9ACTN|nr:methylated-DNA--[protein]-cysteine S-methyltransferase [Patulibacter medicamentivorans]EHN09044.1 Methylated-DNA--protein-cysteine methyltransferase [Patulibacter medicamentivorans]